MSCQNAGDFKHSLLCCNLLCFGPGGLKNAAPAAAFVILTARQRVSDNLSIQPGVNHQCPSGQRYLRLFVPSCDCDSSLNYNSLTNVATLKILMAWSKPTKFPATLVLVSWNSWRQNWENQVTIIGIWMWNYLVKKRYDMTSLKCDLFCKSTINIIGTFISTCQRPVWTLIVGWFKKIVDDIYNTLKQVFYLHRL